MKNSLFKFLVIINIFLLSGITSNAQSNYPDVCRYEIHLTDINHTTKSITAHTYVTFTVHSANVSQIDLSLEQFTIDSIIQNGQSLTYTYNDTLLQINLNAPMNAGDTSTISIAYHGITHTEASGWGGFHVDANYAFNMGVGFETDPHNYGRCWYPCVETFIDKALYEFFITTSANKKAFCNGVLNNQTTNPNGTIIWNWKMNDLIPTYLASVAVGPYTTWQRNYQGLPIEIACTTSDSAAVSASMIHLNDVLGYFINAYGSYAFDKVGYCLVPFNAGAMEHATSIHIGKSYFNGTLTYETLWAHELAHMWWGDKVTCETAADMWLNEGFASFNEAYMTEQLYGSDAYKAYNLNNHKGVLQFSHITDNSYLAMNKIPMSCTYGSTVYNKGADVVRTLRHYLGDSLFFIGCKHYMNSRQYANANSYQLRDDITSSTNVNVNRFFNDWVFTPGFPHFSIDSIAKKSNGSNWNYQIYTKQKSKGNNHIYEMPVKITAYDYLNNYDTTFTVLINQQTQSFTISNSHLFDEFYVDVNDEMADAQINLRKTITGPITSNTGVSFSEANVSTTVMNAPAGNNQLNITHHFVGPDEFQTTQPIRLSDYRYWSVGGNFKTGFRAKANFLYNGSVNLSTGHLDNTLITGLEDSLVLLYRSGTSEDWKIETNSTLVKSGSATDKVGYIAVDTLKKGEYCLGYRDYTVGMSTNQSNLINYLEVSPNPSSDTFCIKINGALTKKYMISIYDLAGKEIYNNTIIQDNSITWQPKNIKKGFYLVNLISEGQIIDTKKIVYQ
jgi:aminopeptidase N